MRGYLIEAALKEKGGAFTFNCRRFHRHLRRRKMRPVDVSVIWSVVFTEYGGAAIEAWVRNGRRHALIDRRKVVEILGVGG